MKFARYLQDTQIPEWKKAYIDYRGLKVQLGVIRAQAPQQVDASSSIGATGADYTHHSAPNSGQYDDPKGMNGAMDSSGHVQAFPMKRRASNREKPSLSVTLASLPPRIMRAASNAPSQQTPLPPRTPRSPPVFPFFRDSRDSGFLASPPLHIIRSNLPAAYAKFFDMLDAELDKVETFYAEREKEMLERAKRLREQFNELGVHRQMYHQSSAGAKAPSWTKSVPSALLPLIQWLSDPIKRKESCKVGSNGILAAESGCGETRGVIDTTKLGMPGGDHSAAQIQETERNPDGSSKSNAASPSKALDDSTKPLPKRSNSPPKLSGGTRNPHDPHEYHHAKRRLRKAVIEHYRGLEVLNNYRILNLTGFRKALKKYEKITNHSVLDAYMKEKVEPSAFASGAIVSTMLKEMEELFTTRFEHGDRKKAIDRLRVGPSSKTHHFSSFRSGLWLGLALPAIAGGAYLSFQESTRGSLTSWNILLFIYSIFLMPVLLALLIGLNIAVWARERINYVFIFELDPRSKLDHHEYFELPSVLFSTLALAFWFSLAQIGPPMLWPLIWLAFALFIMFNPIRKFMWGNARWWIIKNVAKLGVSGVWRVEFTDFWLGDQFCSLVYTLSHLYFVGCFYTHYVVHFPTTTIRAPILSKALLHASFSNNITSTYQLELLSASSTFQRLLTSSYDPQVQDAWLTCGGTRNWTWYYLLGVLPFMVRFVQSLRRYRDSRLLTHLINAGKYGMGMIYYFFYYYWRYQAGPHIGASYVLWLFTATVYAIYGCTWDFLMDWSMLKPHAQYPLLRTELVYKTQIPSYYFAIISNLCIRFLWLIYIPRGEANYTLRTFIVALMEMLRRVQWNFYRLENEHLGNIDQYRVTREVPLPYHFDVQSNEEAEEAEEAEEEEHEEHEADRDREEVERASRRSWMKRRMVRSMRNGGHG